MSAWYAVNRLAHRGGRTEPGRRARLLSGPFADYVGTLPQRPAKGPVMVLPRVLGRDVETLISTRQIAAA